MFTCVMYAFQNFGDYESAHSGGVYLVKTSEGEAIGQLVEGYIHLIMEAVSTAHLVSGPLIPNDYLPHVL